MDKHIASRKLDAGSVLLTQINRILYVSIYWALYGPFTHIIQVCLIGKEHFASDSVNILEGRAQFTKQL